MSWRPTASLRMLRQRAELLWRLRSFFHSRGFLEVQVPVLSRDTVVDRHIDPIAVPSTQFGVSCLEPQSFYLQTSPEFGMKRLLAAGMQAIYQIGPVFRADERGDHHNTEFTMVEWYRVGDDYHAGVEFLSDLVTATLPFDGEPESMPRRGIEKLTYQDAFRRHTHMAEGNTATVNPATSTVVDPLSATMPELAQLANSILNIPLDWSNDRDDWLNLLFAQRVQPQLGIHTPAIVMDFPASQSALAKINAADSRVAERYELFIGGIEIANGYHELLDADELAARNAEVNRQRLGDGKQPLPAASRLLDAMRSGLPACSGCALGFDRLLMASAGADRIDDVLAFPIELS